MHHPLYILIPTHGRPDLLRRTLDSLAMCRIPKCLAQTIVIENGGQNGAEAVTADASTRLNISYRYTAKGNKSHALNVILPELNDGLVVFFDDDVRLHANVLEAYADAAQRIGEGHFFGGPFGVDYETEPPSWLKKYLTPCALGWEPTSGNRQLDDITTFLGFNWAAFTRDLKETGGFNEDLGPGLSASGQESDMQVRLRTAGVIPEYLPDAKVWHYVPAKRCSPEWLLERAARVERGMATLATTKPTRLQYLAKQIAFRVEPRWMRRRFTSRFGTNEESRFLAEYHIACRRARLEMMK